MYIINVIPLIKIPHPNPQILSYFSENKIPIGFLVKISLRNKKLNALVVESKSLEQERLRLKKLSDFEIKPIEKVISKKPVLDHDQIKLLLWISDYYWTPVGMVARIFLSKKIPAYNKSSLVLTPQNKGMVFAPLNNLKSIIVNDESNDLYRSWGRKPYYNAKDIAIQLAKIHKAKLTLKSKLPSIETYYHVQNKEFKLEILNTKCRVPNVNLVDMREEIKNRNPSTISRELQEKLQNSNKSILFITRRGTSTFVLCRECGYIANCPKCEVPMIYHEDKPSKKLVCHHCGKDDIAPVLCPNCKSIKIKYFGAGTQKLEKEAKNLFPNKKIFRLDSDISEKPNEQQKIIKEFNASNDTILIGSQMILNKNLRTNLVGIISLDTILGLPDFKSSERVFQTINRLRGMTDELFLLQTYHPENLAIKSAIENDFNKFYNEEIKIRKTFSYPPFSQIIKLTYSHKDPIRAKNEPIILKAKLEQQINSVFRNEDAKSKINLLGPVPAFIPKEKGLYKWNIVIKSKLSIEERNKLLIIVPPAWEAEVDPDNLL